MNYNFVVIEGNIGAGKTTLSTHIANDFNSKLILEKFAENPFLPKFYKEPDKYSFQLELSFLADRFHQLKQEFVNYDLFKSFLVSDYYFMKSLVFAKQTLQDDEYKLYRSIFNIIYHTLPKPDLYVYLYVTPENLLANIKKRGRDYEMDITKEYLEKIQNSYFEFFKQEKDIRFLIIDTNNIDFVGNAEHYDLIKDAIFTTECKKGINTLIL
jgi:deoxyguanosine kinase